MRLKITIGINLAEKNPMTGMHMMCIPNIAVLVEFFSFSKAPKEPQSGFTTACAISTTLFIPVPEKLMSTVGP